VKSAVIGITDWESMDIALETVIKTRCEYILISSTAASLPQTVLITVSNAITTPLMFYYAFNVLLRFLEAWQGGW
jgi:hypothetical protein